MLTEIITDRTFFGELISGCRYRFRCFEIQSPLQIRISRRPELFMITETDLGFAGIFQTTATDFDFSAIDSVMTSVPKVVAFFHPQHGAMLIYPSSDRRHPHQPFWPK